MKTFKQTTEELYTKAAEKLVVLPGVSMTEAEHLGKLLAEAFPCPPLRPPWQTKEKYVAEVQKMAWARMQIRNMAMERLHITLP